MRRLKRRVARQELAAVTDKQASLLAAEARQVALAVAVEEAPAHAAQAQVPDVAPLIAAETRKWNAHC